MASIVFLAGIGRLEKLHIPSLLIPPLRYSSYVCVVAFPETQRRGLKSSSFKYALHARR